MIYLKIDRTNNILKKGTFANKNPARSTSNPRATVERSGIEIVNSSNFSFANEIV